MALSDLTLAELQEFRPEVEEPKDFDDFWAYQLAQARAKSKAAVIEKAEVSDFLTTVRASDITFSGFAGDPVKAWLLSGAQTPKDAPVVVEFLGYGGGRGDVLEWLPFSAAGFHHLVMDTRGQGSHWGSGGNTPDPHGSGPAATGMMTRGIESPETYYYTRLVVDAVRAVDAAHEIFPESNVYLTGMSQGGGLAIAAANLGERVAGLMANVAFLCNFRRAVEITEEKPFIEITRYLSVHRQAEAQVFKTLSYIDGVNHARRIGIPALFSVGLCDTVVPPSTTYTAFNYLGEKVGRNPETIMEVYAYNNHEGGGFAQIRRQIEWIKQLEQ
ncbi:MAG: acetylxylan esterase [Arcanobacterium sp.]|nr:acetylxylan esterase [Arcanobacterium sp.]